MARAQGWGPSAAAAAALVLLLAAAVPLAAAARAQGKGAKITLQAKWEGTPFLHEAAEFLADEDPALFWRFIEEWQGQLPSLGTSPLQCWAGIRGAAAAHLSPTMARLFDASLAARQYSARLQAFHQLAEDSAAELATAAGAGSRPCCWALLGGRAYTEAGPLREAVHAALAAESHGVEGGVGAVYPFDHVYASPAALIAPPFNITGRGTVPVELFAPIGSACGAQLHDVLAAAAARSDTAAAAAAAAGAPPPPRLAYAWRPLLEGAACGASDVHACTRLGTGERLVLPGYGVELALKNMEYNAQDDKKEANTDKKQEGGEEEAGEEAAAAEGEVDDDSEDDGVLQLKLKNLGLQAAQRVLNAGAAGGEHDPLAVLQEVAQDFPRLVRQVNQQKYGKSLRLAVEGLQRYVPAGAQFLLLNGLVVDTRDFSLYDLLDTLRREVRLYDALSATGLPPAQVRQAQLLRGAAAGADQPPRLRLPLEDGVLWVNDIEKDEKYEDWPSDLNSLLMPMFPGRLPMVRRNILTAVYLFDPASPAALDIGALARQVDLQMWPLRIGLVPVVAHRAAHARGAPGPKSGDPPSASERMGRLLSLIARAQGGEALTEFLFELRAAVSPGEEKGPGWGERLWERASRLLAEQWEVWGGSDNDWTADQVLEQAAAPGDGAAASLGLPALKLLDAAAELAVNSGLAAMCKSGVLVLNGAVSANEGGGGWQGVTMQALHPQLQAVQEDVYMQRLSGRSADLLEDILKLHGSVSRYNPRILPLDLGAGYIRISGETEEFAARPLSLSGPLLGLNATAPHPGTPDGAGLWVRYFGPEPSLVDDEAEEGGSQGGGEAGGSTGKQPLAAVTHWVVADVASHQGLRLVASALQHRSSEGRVALVVNAARAGAPGVPPAQQLAPIERLLVAVSAGLFETDRSDFAEQLDAVLHRAEQPSELTLEHLDEITGFGGKLAAALDGLAGRLPAAAASQARFARSALGLPSGANAVVSNGRVVELPAEGEAEPQADGSADLAAASSAGAADLEPADFELLELYAQRNQYSQEVAQLVRQAAQAGALAGADASAVAAAVSSALAASKPDDIDGRSGRVAELISSWSSQRNALRLPAPAAEQQQEGGAPAAPLLVQAILNPLSKPAQRLAPLLRFLRAALGAETHLLLNPQREYEDMPLKTFYRYVLPALPSGEGPPAAAAAEFARLPGSKVLTLGMDEPEAWLVEPVRAQHDLDNLRLEELPPGQPAMEALYELEALLLTGMCLDLASLQARLRDQIHPRGVQLQLLALSAPRQAPPLVDTLVMSNLGYFQLKSRPGLWKLKLAPGHSQELYTIASSTGASRSGQRAEAAVAGADAHQVPVALTSFTGKHMHLFLRKHPDRLHEDVLEAGGAEGEEGKGTLWSKVASWGKGGPPAEAGATAGVPASGSAEDSRIHVFTVASGHMYERLQKIMVLSAIKRTRARVKFWFIKNYMSPQMKAFVPYMAKKYDFDYEFVTYKWPSWLHKQTEKQRIIWAYKILFLDVLFPLGLKKVIFCDSDQVVRADLLELWNMDLHGAPYGYTPFCDNNREMEGFRFWKQGFWKDHLQGRPYHISALYVVDLERFRQMAAGDRLRVIYDGLSKDPNSLANLDQDLPNYAQHGVPIFSLPNEWLWCETWCGNETRPQAKTIDLCNNPLTKEPKLQSARRIIAEWPDLDREAVEFTAAVDRVQHGEWGEEQLMANGSAFHVRLQPMVEGSTWTSEQGVAAEADAAPWQAEPGPAAQAGGSGAAHDATEL
ncbi:hypothetical protein ABPG75_009137 [Micractinium tetrahymenae]